jgi:hypothetical protein
VDQAAFVRLDAAILGDFAFAALGRVSTSLCFVRVRSTVVRGGRGTSSVFRVMTVSSEWAVVDIEDVEMGCPPGAERRSALVERALADRNDLKASVSAVLVILVGEASGLLASIGFGFVETRLKVCADGGIAVDAADPFPFSDAVNLIGHGLGSSPIG